MAEYLFRRDNRAQGKTLSQFIQEPLRMMVGLEATTFEEYSVSLGRFPTLQNRGSYGWLDIRNHDTVECAASVCEAGGVRRLQWVPVNNTTGYVVLLDRDRRLKGLSRPVARRAEPLFPSAGKHKRHFAECGACSYVVEPIPIIGRALIAEMEA